MTGFLWSSLVAGCRVVVPGVEELLVRRSARCRMFGGAGTGRLCAWSMM